jgi:hypothetical protein
VAEAADQQLNDLIRGDVRFPGGMVGDFVLLRSNGLPTYNFACVVDDSGMRISHVIRAEEHLSNTARQLMLYHALDETPPRFAHVPLILNRDRTKMSKRSGEAAVAVGDWRRDGFVPEALLSYLSLLGFHPGDDREILTRAELLECFTLDRVGKSGSVFDADKLRWVNSHYLHHASGAQLAAWGEDFCRRVPPASMPAGVPRCSKACAAISPPWPTCRASSRRFSRMRWSSNPMRGCAGAPRAASCARRSPPHSRNLRSGTGNRLNPRFNPSDAPWDEGRELFQPIRAALTGRTTVPSFRWSRNCWAAIAVSRACARPPTSAGERNESRSADGRHDRPSARSRCAPARAWRRRLKRLGHEALPVDAADGRLLPAGDEERDASPATALEPAQPGALVNAAALRDADVVLIACTAARARTEPCRRCSSSRASPTRARVSGQRAGDEQGDVEARLRAGRNSHTAVDAGAAEGLLSALIGSATFRHDSELGLPVVIKPNEEGSTVGLTIVRSGAACRGVLGRGALRARDAGRGVHRGARADRGGDGRDGPADRGDPAQERDLRLRGQVHRGTQRVFLPADLAEPLAQQIRDLGLRASRMPRLPRRQPRGLPA